MPRLTQTQTGAFCGILASVLIFVLTAMALASGLPRHHAHFSAGLVQGQPNLDRTQRQSLTET